MQNQVLNIRIPKEATGLKVIQLANWSGVCFVVPRADLRDLKEREESHNPGIYFLFGEADESTNQKLYIGESEDFFYRLTTHNDSKDFWNTALVFTGSLDKAKIKYLEYLSTKNAKSSGRYDLMNTTKPAENMLSEFDLATTESYFEKIKYILSVLGYPVFDSIKESISDKNFYFLKGEGFDAKSQLIDDGSLNVFKGALVRVKETDSFTGWSLATRKKFVADGTLKMTEDGVSYVLIKDILFKSPSAAAATLSGRAINGWTAWKDKDGNTLDENLRK